MKKLVIALLLLSVSAWAGFGGSRAGGFSGGARSFSSGARSSFGGSRSSGAATITRPSAPSYSRTYSRPPVVHETVIHNSSSGFTNGLLLGTMLNNHPVVVAPPVAPVVEGTVVVQSHSGFYYLMWFMVWVGIIAGLIWIVRRET